MFRPNQISVKELCSSTTAQGGNGTHWPDGTADGMVNSISDSPNANLVFVVQIYCVHTCGRESYGLSVRDRGDFIDLLKSARAENPAQNVP